ncbi:MAG: flagellar hook-length control protein FliK, partial [Acidimicrobiales bacterium]
PTSDARAVGVAAIVTPLPVAPAHLVTSGAKGTGHLDSTRMEYAATLTANNAGSVTATDPRGAATASTASPTSTSPSTPAHPVASGAKDTGNLGFVPEPPASVRVPSDLPRRPTTPGATNDVAPGSVNQPHVASAAALTSTPSNAGAGVGAASSRSTRAGAAASSGAPSQVLESSSLTPQGQFPTSPAPATTVDSTNATSVLDHAPGPKGAKTSSSGAPSNQAAGQSAMQGVATPNSGASAIASIAPQALHSNVVRSSNSGGVSSTGGSSSVMAGSVVTSSFQAQMSALDVGGLSGAISRPLSEGNGTYTVVLAMHPADLGHVQAVMTLSAGTLQVSLTPQTNHGHSALALATNELKNELASGGLNVTIDLHQPQSQTPRDGRRSERPTPVDRNTSVPTPDVARETTIRGAGRINLML